MKCTCKHCGYKWESRVEKPVSCPYCKQYIKRAKEDRKEGE